MPAGPDPTHPLRSVLSSSSFLPPLPQPQGLLTAPQKILPQGLCICCACCLPCLSTSSWHMPPSPSTSPLDLFSPGLCCPHGNQLQDGFRQDAEPGLPCVPLGEVQARERKLAHSLQSLTPSCPRGQSSYSTLWPHSSGWDVAPRERENRLGKMPQIRKQHFPHGRRCAEPLIYYPFRWDRRCLDGRSRELAPGHRTWQLQHGSPVTCCSALWSSLFASLWA